MKKQEKLKIEKAQLEQENQSLKETIKVYQDHLEKVIEHNSVEKYRNLVSKNREVD